ncbi:MAG: hypothetical protein QN229_03955 [Desulfurococcaceae archaeon TW002]
MSCSLACVSQVLSHAFVDSPHNHELDIKSNTSDIGFTSSLGSLIFGIAKSLVVDLFLGSISGPLAKLLGFVEYTDTTFSASVVLQYLRWVRTAEAENNVYVDAWKRSKSMSYLSNYYDEINKKPLVKVEGGPPPCPPDDPDCLLPLQEED